MKNKKEEAVTAAINNITGKVSEVMLQEYMKLPADIQIGLILIKSTQLLLANVLCQIAADHDELNKLMDEQAEDIKELTHTCAHTGFADKFKTHTH